MDVRKLIDAIIDCGYTVHNIPARITIDQGDESRVVTGKMSYETSDAIVQAIAERILEAHETEEQNRLRLNHDRRRKELHASYSFIESRD